MSFQLKSITRPTDQPKLVAYSDYRDFRDRAPKDSKYLTHEGVLIHKKRINAENFKEVAEEVTESTTIPQEPPRTGALAEAVTKSNSNPPPASNTPPAKSLPSPTTQPAATAPPINFDALGKVLSDAITNSVQGSTGKAAEAWTAASKAAVEESNTQLNNPLFPASGPATGSFNGLHAKSKFLAATKPMPWRTPSAPSSPARSTNPDFSTVAWQQAAWRKHPAPSPSRR